MRCPLCLSDNLEYVQETYCCDNCGGSFAIVQESQDFPIDKQEIVEMVDKINEGDKNPYTLEKILSYLQKEVINFNEEYDHYSITLGKGNLKED